MFSTLVILPYKMQKGKFKIHIVSFKVQKVTSLGKIRNLNKLVLQERGKLDHRYNVNLSEQKREPKTASTHTWP